MIADLGAPMPGKVEAMRALRDASIGLLSSSEAALVGPASTIWPRGRRPPPDPTHLALDPISVPG